MSHSQRKSVTWCESLSTNSVSNAAQPGTLLISPPPVMSSYSGNETSEATLASEPMSGEQISPRMTDSVRTKSAGRRTSTPRRPSANRPAVGGSPRGSNITRLPSSNTNRSPTTSTLPSVSNPGSPRAVPPSYSSGGMNEGITTMKAMVVSRGTTSSPKAKPKTGKQAKPLTIAHRPGPQQKQMVPKAFQEPHPFHEVTDPLTGGKILAPEGYSMRPIVPAKKFEVVAMAKAMNDDFGPRVKQLFDPERQAALAAQQTGVYIGWRCPEFKHDCQRVGTMSKCFCGHLLGEHKQFTGKSLQVPCAQARCKCRSFQWIPSRPEEVGEFWFQRRRNFDPSQWRAKCKCKHPHDQHCAMMKRCQAKGCGCSHFISNFLCAACDRHWEDHETFFETEDMRKMAGLPYGEAYLPFAEMPDLRNAVLTGDEYDESVYLALTQGQGAIPDNPATGNNMVVPYRSSSQSLQSLSRTGFRPVYD